MYKKIIKIFKSIIFLQLILAMTFIDGKVKAVSNSVTQIGGATRYETAAKVATTNWKTSDNAVLVSGEEYGDAISGVVLAKKLNAPIIFTNSKELNRNAKDVLRNLKVKKVYIIGGTGSISQYIENNLKNNYKVIRLGGNTRYDTNLIVAKYLTNNLGLSKENIIVVSGEGFSDALVAAPIASAKNELLLFTNNNKHLIKDTIDFVKDSKITVIGTTNTVSDSIYKTLNADKRIKGGLNRFDTNLNVLKAFDSDLKNNKIYMVNAAGNNYADAVIASALAGKYLAPLVLIDDKVAIANDNIVNYIKTKATKDTNFQVIGGIKVIPKDVITKLNNIITGDDTVIIFKDKNLERFIRANVNKPNGALYKSDVNKLLDVYFYFAKIKDINGIENLVNVQRLRLGYNKIVDISPLKSLVNLSWISLTDNEIVDISPLKNLVNLKGLEVGYNEIVDISPLKNLINLESLNLNRNKISDISMVKNLVNLESLDLSRNKVSDISPLKNLPNLKHLNLSKNPIKGISLLKELINLRELRELILSEGQLSNDDIDSLKKSLPNLQIRFE